MTGQIRKSTLILYTFFIAFWITGVFPFIIQEIASDKCESVRLVVNNAMQLLMMLVGLWTLRNRTDIIIIAVFAALSGYSSLVINEESVLVWLNGFRRYIGYLFTLPIVRYFFAETERRDRFVHAFDANIFYFLAVQAPCICVQAIRWGIGDKGGGSLGWDNSGVISQMIYMMSFYLMIRRWDSQKSYIANLWSNIVLVALLFPTFLNETKISFVFLLLYFVLLLPMDRTFVKRLIVLVPLLTLIMIGAGYWYLNSIKTKDDVFSLAYMNDYVLGNNMIDWAFEIMDNDDVDTDEIWEKDYARGIKFALLPTLLERGGPQNEIWGYGLGQFKGGNGMDKTEFAKRYEWLLRGTQTELFNICVEMGYLGVALYFIYWIAILRMFRRCRHGRDRRLFVWMTAGIFIMALYTAGFDLLPYVLACYYMAYCSMHRDTLPPYRMPALLTGRRKETPAACCD